MVRSAGGGSNRFGGCAANQAQRLPVWFLLRECLSQYLEHGEPVCDGELGRVDGGELLAECLDGCHGVVLPACWLVLLWLVVAAAGDGIRCAVGRCWFRWFASGCRCVAATLHGVSLTFRGMSNGTVVDPRERTAASWSGRLAALKSRGVEDSDPRAVEAQAALSFHRLKRVIDAEVAAGHMADWFGAKVTDLLAAEVTS